MQQKKRKTNEIENQREHNHFVLNAKMKKLGVLIIFCE